jgi:hypothetical protein
MYKSPEITAYSADDLRELAGPVETCYLPDQMQCTNDAGKGPEVCIQLGDCPEFDLSGRVMMFVVGSPFPPIEVPGSRVGDTWCGLVPFAMAGDEVEVYVLTNGEESNHISCIIPPAAGGP